LIALAQHVHQFSMGRMLWRLSK